MTHYKKLVRDKIPQKLDRKSVPYVQTIATEVEYERELKKKLQEEVSEFIDSGDAEELADIFEVMAALQLLPAYANIEHVRQEKYDRLGGFSERLILEGDDDN